MAVFFIERYAHLFICLGNKLYAKLKPLSDTRKNNVACIKMVDGTQKPLDFYDSFKYEKSSLLGIL